MSGYSTKIRIDRISNVTALEHHLRGFIHLRDWDLASECADRILFLKGYH